MAGVFLLFHLEALFTLGSIARETGCLVVRDYDYLRSDSTVEVVWLHQREVWQWIGKRQHVCFEEISVGSRFESKTTTSLRFVGIRTIFAARAMPAARD
jgi:hypothetical protein